APRPAGPAARRHGAAPVAAAEPHLALPRADDGVRPRQHRERRVARADRRARLDVLDDPADPRAGGDLDLARRAARGARPVGGVAPTAPPRGQVSPGLGRDGLLTVPFGGLSPSRNRHAGDKRALAGINTGGARSRTWNPLAFS